jgi:(2Fe-2S) ferredoxin
MTIEELDQIAEATRAEYANYDHEINVCMGTGCLSQHSDKLRDELTKAVAAQGKNAFVRRTGCMGLCAAGPLALVDPEETLYQHCNASHAESIAASLGGAPVAALQCDLRESMWCLKTPATSIRKRLTTTSPATAIGPSSRRSPRCRPTM